MYDELVKSLRICSRCDFGQNCNGCKQKSDDAFCCDKLLHEAADAIEELQTDMRPVVRGEWEEVGGEDEVWQYYRCTRCGAISIARFHFCPHCGADMREES